MANPNMKPSDTPNTPDATFDSPGPELDPAGPRTTVEDAMDIATEDAGHSDESAYSPPDDLTEPTPPDEREYLPNGEEPFEDDRDEHAEDPDASLDPDVRNEVRQARESDRDAGVEGPPDGRFTDDPD